MGLYEALKDLAKVVQRMDNIEVTQKLLDVQAQAMALIEENARVKADMRELKERLDVSDSLVFRDNRYYRLTEDGDEDGPFCSKCWDADQKLIRLHRPDPKWVRCPNCKHDLEGPPIGLDFA